MNRHKLAIATAALAAIGLPATLALAVDPVLSDGFNNGVVENADAAAGFWTARNSGSASIAAESGGRLQLTAGGSAFPHSQIASGVQNNFNFFRTPMVISASSLNFTSTTNSLNKGILRFSLSSRTLFDTAPVPPAPVGADDSEYWADDVLAFRIESGNNTPGQYTVALGIKENYPQHNSEYDGFFLFNPIINPAAVFPGPIRAFTLTYSPKFWDLTITHDASPTDATQMTRHITGAVDQFLGNWHDPSDAGPVTGNSAMFVQSQLNSAAPTERATASIDGLTVGQLVQNWQGSAAGDWSNAANWSDGNILHINGDGSTSSVPNFVGANVRFPSTAGPQIVTVDLDQTVGRLVFDSAQPYTVQPGGLGQGTLQMDTRWFANEIVSLQGNHTIVSPINTYKDLTLDASAGASVKLLGPIVDTSNIGTATLGKTGAGLAEVNNIRFVFANVQAGTLKVTNTALPLDPAATSKVFQLDIAGGPAAPTAKLDLGNNALVIDYFGGSPIDSVRQLLRAGQVSGQGLVSTGGGAGTRLGYGEASILASGGSFAGQSADGSSVIVAYALGGDANLSNIVDIDDFGVLAAKFNQAGLWTDGDFDYTGIIDIDDFGILAANFNRSLAGAAGRGAAVPEPTSALLIAVSGLLGCRRRA